VGGAYHPNILTSFLGGSQRVFYPGPCLLASLFAAFISHFPLLVYCALSGAQPPLLLWRFLALWFSFTLSISGCIPHGSLRHLLAASRLLTWIRFKNLSPPETVWGHLRTADQDSDFPSCHLTHLIYTSHSLQYPEHQDITWSPLGHFLSWTVHKFM
jgi:hypothetical protein